MEIGGRLDYPCLTKELSEDIEKLWKDPAIQVTHLVLVALLCLTSLDACILQLVLLTLTCSL